MGYMYFLTPSKSNLIDECERCFYLEITKKAPRPRGIFPSLPSGVDIMLKTRYDRYRALGFLPEEIQLDVTGNLFSDQDMLKKMRHWQGPLKIVFKDHGITLRGGIDDLVIEVDNTFSVLDYKTKSTAPDDGYAAKYYQSQLDDYTLMLESCFASLEEDHPFYGIKSSGKAYVVYYYLPQIDIIMGHNDKNILLDFECKVQVIDVSIDKAKKRINKAYAILKNPEAPGSSHDCPYCKYAIERGGE